MYCESNSWRPSLPDNRDILEHCCAAKHPLVRSIRGTHKRHLERGMLNQRPTLDIACSNRYQGWAQVDQVISNLIQSVRDNPGDLYDRHCCESATERLEFIDSLLADNKYLFHIAECVEGGVRGPNKMQRKLKAANKWQAFTLLPGDKSLEVYWHQILWSRE